MKKALTIFLWLCFAGMIVGSIAAVGAMGPLMFTALAGGSSGGSVFFLISAYFFTFLLFALLIRDSLRGKSWAAVILALLTLPLSWLQLYYGNYALTALALQPLATTAAVVALLLNIGLGLGAVLCLHSAAGSALQRTKEWDETVLVFIFLSGVLTAVLAGRAISAGAGYLDLADRASAPVSAAVEEQLLKDDETVLNNPDLLVQIARSGEKREARAKAVEVLLKRHNRDPRALIGLQLNVQEEFKRIEEAIGQQPNRPAKKHIRPDLPIINP